MPSTSYTAVHKWIKRVAGRPNRCSACRKPGRYGIGGKQSIHWANISGRYARDRQDWRPLCVPCHRRFDYRKGAYHLHGEAHQWAKLKPAQVLRIRAAYAKGGESYATLAAKYNVYWGTIRLIVKRRNWKHL